MLDNLQEAYTAYQQALYHLRDPKEPKLWYGIGILYDRYGSLDHAEEAFSQVMRMQPDFEKANEIYFRLGIIYKQQQKFGQSLDVSAIRCPIIGGLSAYTTVLGSVLDTSSTTHLVRLRKKTSGSRSAMFMNSRKTYVSSPWSC